MGEVGEAVGGLAQCLSKMPWVGEYRHDQRLDQGEPMPPLLLVRVVGSREGTVQLAQEQDDGLFVHHGGLSVDGHHRTPGPESAATFCSLATLLVDSSLPIGNLGEWVAVTAKARKGHGPRPGELAEAMAPTFSTLLGAVGAGR